MKEIILNLDQLKEMYSSVSRKDFERFCLEMEIITDIEGIRFLQELEMGDAEVTFETFNQN